VYKIRYNAEAVTLTSICVFVYSTRLCSFTSEKCFTARRYTSAVYAVVCPSVCLSVCHKPVLYRNDCTNSAGFPPIPHSVVRNFGYLQKLGYFPLGLCPKLRTWENFATASRSRCQQHSSSSSSTVEFVDDTYTTIDQS